MTVSRPFEPEEHGREHGKYFEIFGGCGHKNTKDQKSV